MVDYVNENPRQGEKFNKEPIQTERRVYCLMFLSVGVLCIIQAVLNVSLRLTVHSCEIFGCNTTQLCGKNHRKEDCEQFDKLKCLTLTRDLSILENRNSELLRIIEKMAEERDRLKFKLNELNGCGLSQQCPPEWKELNSKCYFLSTESKTWEDSQKYCQGKGANLVVINDEQEQNAIYRLDGNHYLLFWIGLRRSKNGFEWVDGSQLKNTFWQDGQPDYGGPNNMEDCVEMYHRSPVLASWNDAPCGNKHQWLCEKDLCLSL